MFKGNKTMQKKTQRFKEARPMMATSSVVCSYLLILSQLITTTLTMKYNKRCKRMQRLCV